MGSLGGAPYRIVVPEEWNGTLLAYVHGYNEATIPALIAPPNIDQTAFLSRGLALAGSRFKEGGLAIKEGSHTMNDGAPSKPACHAGLLLRVRFAADGTSPPGPRCYDPPESRDA